MESVLQGRPPLLGREWSSEGEVRGEVKGRKLGNWGTGELVSKWGKGTDYIHSNSRRNYWTSLCTLRVKVSECTETQAHLRECTKCRQFHGNCQKHTPMLCPILITICYSRRKRGRKAACRYTTPLPNQSIVLNARCKKRGQVVYLRSKARTMRRTLGWMCKRFKSVL